MAKNRNLLASVIAVGLLTGPMAAHAAPVLYSANGHYYEFVSAPANSISWDTARSAATGLTYSGMSGYLATITSSGENAFVYSLLAAVEGAWVGGTETATEGEFMWADGPEAGQVFWSNGPVLGSYTNWDGTEPNNNTVQGNEDRLQMLGGVGTGGGAWNDLANGNTFYRINGYVVEYSPVPLPAAAWLLLSGLAGLGVFGRRRTMA